MNKILKRALISVSDKSGIVDLAQCLQQNGVEIIASGGTARTLFAANITVTEVSDVTGTPEMLDGRVKTLHPSIHAGILARRGTDDGQLSTHDIQGIDLVVCNLYPFKQAIAKPDCHLQDAIEQIDIGGPTLIRAAAKNHQDVLVLCAPADYQWLVDNIATFAEITFNERYMLAAKAFAYTARYEADIANYFNQHDSEGQTKPFPDVYTIQMKDSRALRYGENPHQAAMLYSESGCDVPSIVHAKQHQGKALSFNNISDADTALECVRQFPDDGFYCAIVKHNNPCGVAEGSNLTEAYQRAYAGDPISAFGGIIAFNQPLDAITAKIIIEQQFVEVILAPEIDEEALKLLANKPNIRLLSTGVWSLELIPGLDIKRLTAGYLIQERDIGVVNIANLQNVSRKTPSEAEFLDLLFAWQVAKYVKSNAIVFAKEKQTLGIGVGQPSRIAASKAGILQAQTHSHDIPGSVMASDAFFPFRDGIDAAAEVGVSAIIQPGGSQRDDEVIQACNEHDIALIFTGMRHFRH